LLGLFPEEEKIQRLKPGFFRASYRPGLWTALRAEAVHAPKRVYQERENVKRLEESKRFGAKRQKLLEPPQTAYRFNQRCRAVIGDHDSIGFNSPVNAAGL
jgi:hypothetical protein